MKQHAQSVKSDIIAGLAEQSELLGAGPKLIGIIHPIHPPRCSFPPPLMESQHLPRTTHTHAHIKYSHTGRRAIWLWVDLGAVPVYHPANSAQFPTGIQWKGLMH